MAETELPTGGSPKKDPGLDTPKKRSGTQGKRFIDGIEVVYDPKSLGVESIFAVRVEALEFAIARTLKVVHVGFGQDVPSAIERAEQGVR